MPSKAFQPFGPDGPKILLFGIETGDWRMGSLQSKVSDYPGMYYKLSELARKHSFSCLAIPTPTECNTEVCRISSFEHCISDGVGSLKVYRGAEVDGVILAKGLSGAIASADCPTIVAYSQPNNVAVVAHGGSKSLIDVKYAFGAKQTPRNTFSVVDNVVSQMWLHGCKRFQVFVTCGISCQNYPYPELVPFVQKQYGNGCVSGCGINLHKIIASQFEDHGIYDVTTDLIDTFGDLDGDSPLWHSYRRGKTSDEKMARNLVLVVN